SRLHQPHRRCRRPRHVRLRTRPLRLTVSPWSTTTEGRSTGPVLGRSSPVRAALTAQPVEGPDTLPPSTTGGPVLPPLGLRTKPMQSHSSCEPTPCPSVAR